MKAKFTISYNPFFLISSIIAGEDFNTEAQMAVIMPGDTSVCVNIQVNNDQRDELNEQFCVQLSSTDANVQFGTDPCHICVTIMDPQIEGMCVIQTNDD